MDEIIKYGPLITAGATFVAACIALFKESIISLWKKPNVKVLKSYSDWLREVIDNERSEESPEDNVEELHNSKDLIVASFYELVVQFKNIGKEPVKDCELYLEKIRYKGKSDINYKDLDGTTGKPIHWFHKDQSIIQIPPYSGKANVTLIKILSKSERSKLKSEKTQLPGLIIGDVTILDKYKNGDYEIEFALYSSNHKPIYLQILFKWNGAWQDRLIEMNSSISVSVKEIEK
ncbi:hypothetical protein [Leptospira yasudae]|uniref:hypothetical protein n=1 Tax=Leptospira yasudae TaxID=2202201 RepID=UPI001090E640|nr:hypothetical protein [Leptospira yasudae]TGM95978.1 hypothetical protein EHR10_18265 [Leptospira yasudae]